MSTCPGRTSTRWGVHDTVLNLSDETIAFCRDVLEHVLSIFPAPWIHIGGDECPTDEWAASPAARKRLADLGIARQSEAQQWWTSQLVTWLLERGRTPHRLGRSRNR